MNDSEHGNDQNDHKKSMDDHPHESKPKVEVFHDHKSEHKTEHTKKRHSSHDSEKKSESAKEDNTSKFLVGAAIVQVILLLFIAVQINDMGGVQAVPSGNADGAAPAQAAPTPSQPSAPAPVLDMDVLIDDDTIKGDKNAPVTIVEWSDFECPFCTKFYTDTLPQLDEQYIKTGKVRLVYRDFPLSFHPNAQKAGEASECAKDQGRFWDMHDKLFDSGVQGGVATFKQYASSLGLDMSKFSSCLESGEKAAEVKKDMNDGAAAGVRGTPGFVVNGKVISGAQPFAVFKQIIDAELAS